MPAPNKNTLWARLFVRELAHQNIQLALLSPGSRSTPLVHALWRENEIEVRAHPDERGAAFQALGAGKTGSRPAVAVSTSGTAAVNFHPAAVEASRARVPLMFLTADRPPELAHSGANQTIDQLKLYGDAVRFFQQVPEPSLDKQSIQSLRTLAGRAVQQAIRSPRGPVHLNFPFKKPLEPSPVPEDREKIEELPSSMKNPETPAVTLTSGVSHPNPDQVKHIASLVDASRHILFVAGPDHRKKTGVNAFFRFGQQFNVPLLADPLSGLRFHPDVQSAPVISGYDGFLHPDLMDQWGQPDLLLRTGRSPTSKRLRKTLAGTDANQVLIDPAGEWREAEFEADHLIDTSPGPLLEAVLERAPSGGESEYRQRWTTCEEKFRKYLKTRSNRYKLEGRAVLESLRMLPEGGRLFVSNSMPVRDLDLCGFARSRSLRVFGNRGASGIDGIISSALGVSAGSGEPTVALVGDLAFLHDMNALARARKSREDRTIVIINNDGGGIFHKLPIESFDPPFEELFLTPHGLNFRAAAEQFDLSYRSAANGEKLEQHLSSFVGESGCQIIEYNVGPARETRKERADFRSSFLDDTQVL